MSGAGPPPGSWRAAAERTDVRGRGRPNERTALSWSRSALSLATIAALILRFGAQGGSYAVAVPLAGVVLAAAAAVARLGSTSYERRHRGDGGYVAEPAAVRLTAAATVFAALAGLIVAALTA